MEIGDCVEQIQSPSQLACTQGVQESFMLEALYDLALRAQTSHSKELKQDIASWCSPQVELIETNQ